MPGTWCQSFTIYNNDSIAYRVLNPARGRTTSGEVAYPGGDKFDMTVPPHSATKAKIPVGDNSLFLSTEPESGEAAFYMGFPPHGEYPVC